MAMTKAEKARMEELQTALAMHWPAYPEPAPMTREQIKSRFESIERRDKSALRYDEKGARGWFFNAHENGRVTYGWTNETLQNRDSVYADSGSRNIEPMYATKTEALMALRLEKTRRFAAVLAATDAAILDATK